MLVDRQPSASIHYQKGYDMTKKICELKKGDKVLLSYGEQKGDIVTCGTYEKWVLLHYTGASYKAWEATVRGTPRGKNPTVVFLEVHGFENDLGDVYAHQIIGYWDESVNNWQKIEHTPKQIEMKKMVESMGF